jgi:hypothetical protein
LVGEEDGAGEGDGVAGADGESDFGAELSLEVDSFLRESVT